MGARLSGSFEQRLLHAHEAGQVGQPLRDPELALDRGIDPAVHSALDRLINSAREVSPAAEAYRDLIGEVPADRSDPCFVIPARASAHACSCSQSLSLPRSASSVSGSVTACTLFRGRK